MAFLPAHRALPALLVTLFTTVPLAGVAAQIEEPRIPLQTKLNEVTRFRAEYADNYNSKKAEAVLGMYADDAVIVGSEGDVFTGKEAIRRFLGAPAEFAHVVIESDDLEIYGNTAVDLGTVKMHPPGGGEIVARYLVVLRRNMNEWKLVRAALSPVN